MLVRSPPTPDEEELLTKLLTANGMAGRAFLFAALVFLLPLAEEAFFRGTLYGGLRRGRPRSVAIVACAGFFTLAHFDMRYVGSTLTLALLVTWMRAESGSLFPSCAAHAAFLAVPATRLLSNPNADDAFPAAVRYGGVVAALAALAGLFVTFRRDARAEAGRERDE